MWISHVGKLLFVSLGYITLRPKKGSQKRFIYLTQHNHDRRRLCCLGNRNCLIWGRVAVFRHLKPLQICGNVFSVSPNGDTAIQLAWHHTVTVIWKEDYLYSSQYWNEPTIVSHSKQFYQLMKQDLLCWHAQPTVSCHNSATVGKKESRSIRGEY